MAKDYNRRTLVSMTYPKKGTLNRLLFKSPLIWWRMGLGPVMSHEALGGRKMLVLTSWGRNSKKPRHTMLSYVQVDGKEYVCSGWGAETDWYKNILANPFVKVQVGSRIYVAKARRVQDIGEYTKIVERLFDTGGDSHFASWLEGFGIRLEKQDMIIKRDRLYVVGFDESGESGPPALSVDLTWVWGLILLLLAWAWRLSAKE